jgi:hypothetical protein
MVLTAQKGRSGAGPINTECSLTNFNSANLVCTENELGTDRFKLGQLRSNADSTTRKLKIGQCDMQSPP